MKKMVFLVFLFTILFATSSLCFAKEEVTVLISGQSHANLYPCHCPSNREGGVARRATAIKNVRKTRKNVLVLDSGLSFAGGKFDFQNLGEELNKRRTEYYLKAVSRMGYDAFLISSGEFNFGDDFLRRMAKQYPLPYVSANVGKKEFSPYIIKKFGKFRIAVIGLSDPEVKEKTKKVYIEPRDALAKIMKEISDNKKAELVIVLSSLDLKKTEEILKNVGGIDLWISSGAPYSGSDIKKINEVTVAVPRWETRGLVRLDYLIDEDGIRLENSGVISLNDGIEDDKGVSSIIPACFSDNDCMALDNKTKKICDNPGTEKAQCKEFKPPQVSLYIIEPAKCITCVNVKENNMLGQLKQALPDMNTVFLAQNSKQADTLIGDLNIKMLPAYLFGKSIEAQDVFDSLKQNLRQLKDYYMIEPSVSGVSYFVGRPEIKNRLDVFFDIATPDMADILIVLDQLKDRNKNIDIRIHFLAMEDEQGRIITKAGQFEAEEYLRYACIDKHFPDQFKYYLSCRLLNIESSWWDDCAVRFKIDPQLIKSCAQTREGSVLLREFIKLTKELEVVFGPTFLINNKEIFGVSAVPRVEEFEKLFKEK